MNLVEPVPQGFHTITPHMVIKGAAEAIELYKKAFGAEEMGRFMLPDSPLVMHAALKIGDSMLMLADEMPSGGCGGMLSPQANRGTTVALHLYVKDVDAAFKRAIDAGCTQNMPP